MPDHPQRTTWAWTIGTFFGIGLIGRGGGTLASVPIVVSWALLAVYYPVAHLHWYVAAFAVVATLIGVAASAAVAHESGKKDPSEVVIDEVAGQAIALIGAPAGWKWALVGFILFRAFDIVKPFPVRQLESLRGGWGVMMDDVMAGVFAALMLQMAVRLFG